MRQRTVSKGLNKQAMVPANPTVRQVRRIVDIREASPPEPVFSDQEWLDLASLLSLSGREREIVQAVANDLKDGTIASRLGISQRTVRTHFERLYRKLGVSSRAGLLLLLFRTVRQSE